MVGSKNIDIVTSFRQDLKIPVSLQMITTQAFKMFRELAFSRKLSMFEIDSVVSK